MTYTKPSIEVLGEAVSFIQEYGKTTPSSVDGNPFGTLIDPNHPAYDLDE